LTTAPSMSLVGKGIARVFNFGSCIFAIAYRFPIFIIIMELLLDWSREEPVPVVAALVLAAPIKEDPSEEDPVPVEEGPVEEDHVKSR